MILGVDVSSYQTTVEWPALYTAGVKFAIVKTSQGQYLQDTMGTSHAQRAKAAGMVVGLYHFMDTSAAPLAQAQYAMGIFQKLPYDFLALDVEELANTNPTPQQITDCARGILDYWKVKTSKPIIIYSRAEYLYNNAAPMLAWCLNYPLWLASYPFKDGRENVTWEELTATAQALTGGPAFPNGWPDKSRKWFMWQFSGDKFVTPGLGTGDYDLYPGSETDLRKWAGLAAPGTPAPEPAPQPEPGQELRATGKVVAPVLNIRTGPGLDYPTIGHKDNGDTVEALQIGGQEVWIKVQDNPSGWCCVRRAGTDFIKMD
jgi:lysozyme